MTDSCREEEASFDGANDEERCRCRSAAVNAYNGMCRAGVSEDKAVEAACCVYRYHHPADSRADARLTVERWIYAQAGRVH